MDDGVEKFAVGVTRLLDRRSFLRKIAGNAFKAAAVLAVGGTLVDVMATPAYANCGGAAGSGCPKVTNINGNVVSRGCGTSRCCNYLRSGTSSNCKCASGTSCKSTTGYCYGKDTRYWGSGCWSCTVTTKYTGGCYYGYTTTCCDCKTNADACNDPDLGSNRGRCIGWSSTYRKLGC